MENEKSKKKKSRRKNNKQNKALEEVSEVQNQPGTEAKDVGIHGKESDVCLSGNGSNVIDSTILVESEKQQWLQKEAILEARIRQLQGEKDNLVQKEATLVGTVNQLTDENNSHLRKEYAFEKVIEQLRDENKSNIQKEADVEIKFNQLQRENDSWVPKQSHLEERISQLVDEKITWDLKELNLEERVKQLEGEKHSWILKEDSNTVIISNLNDIAGLRAEVLELEEARNNLLHENRQLMQNISGLQLQIEDIQTTASTQSSDKLTKLALERDELNSQLEAAFVLVERLMEENAELVEKVSELLILVDRHGGSNGRRITASPELVIGTDNNMPEMDHESNSIETVVPFKEERNGINHSNDNYYSGDELPESSVLGEIVPIPLDENNTSDREILIMENNDNENDATPLSDAPLIGAPFRLISFVSRYVSGADLVDKNYMQV